MDVMKQFRIDRDNALTAAVMQDDWDALKHFCRKYGGDVPKDERVMKVGVYKAAAATIGLPKEVKDVARKKCIALGFKPTMWEG